MTPKVSIIISTYNHAEFLEQAIESAVSQDYKDLEIIIVNDGSTDETPLLLKSLKERYQNLIIINQENKGVIASRNKAINKSTGDYIFCLDADDYIFSSSVISKMMQEIEQVILVYGNYQFFGKYNNLVIPKKYSVVDLLIEGYISSSCLFLKKAFLEVGGYTDYMAEGYEDWELFIRMSQVGKFKKINETIFFYRIQDSSRNAGALKIHDKLVKLIRP